MNEWTKFWYYFMMTNASQICYINVTIFYCRIIIGGGDLSWPVDSLLFTYLYIVYITLCRNWKSMDLQTFFYTSVIHLLWSSCSSCWQVKHLSLLIIVDFLYWINYLAVWRINSFKYQSLMNLIIAFWFEI